MKVYGVELTANSYYEVEAESKEEAIERALDYFEDCEAEISVEELGDVK